MVKQTRKRLRKPKRKSNKRYKRNMFGGLHDISNGPLILSDLDDLNTDEYEENELNISGISNYTDNEPNYLNDSFSDITETNNMLDDSMNTTIDSESILNGDGSNYYDDSNSYNGSNGSLHLSDINISNNNSLNTTREDIEGGKRQRRRKTIKKRKQGNKKSRKQSNKKNRKQRGGMCFGNGVGANSYDPNFSIYNTRELTLFPYKPTN